MLEHLPVALLQNRANYKCKYGPRMQVTNTHSVNQPYLEKADPLDVKEVWCGTWT